MEPLLILTMDSKPLPVDAPGRFSLALSAPPAGKGVMQLTQPRPALWSREYLGCNADHTIGVTEEPGMATIEGKAHVCDFDVTLLHPLGLDDNKLTFYHAGRFKQLSPRGDTAINQLIA
jgi:hypothetical protein